MADLSINPAGGAVEVPKLQEFQAGRRELDFADYIEIARRNIPWLVGPAFLGLVLATAVSFTLPDIYESKATIKLTPTDLPEALLPKLQTRLDERVATITSEVMSRNTLGDIVKRLGLYPNQQKSGTVEEIVEGIKRKGDLRVVYERSAVASSQTVAFTILFRYPDRTKAYQTVKEITDRVVNKNQDTTTKATGIVRDLVTDEYKRAKEKLDGVQAKITAFMSSSGGGTTDQAAVLMAQINSLQSSISNLNARVSQIQQERIMNEGKVQALQSRKAALKPQTVEVQAAVRNQEFEQINQAITRAEAELEAFSRRYTAQHPEVLSRQQFLDGLKARREELAKRMTAPAPATKQTVITPEFLSEQRNIDDAMALLQADARAKDSELQDIEKQRRNYEAQIQGVQNRLAVQPRSQQELLSLMNERQLAQEGFTEADRKMRMAENAQVVEKNQLSERLDVLDGASLPQSPSSPKRVPIVIGGLGAGLALGMVVVGLREIRDTSLKTLKDVRAYTQLGILGTVPLLEDDLITRRRRRLALLGWSTAVLLGMGAMAGSALFYFSTRS
jgi:uncharacterized protein involved in exopolysaccharide biosynthesis